MFLSLGGSYVAFNEGMPARYVLGHLVTTISLIVVARIESVI
jgi:hypothetical protein